VVPHIGARACTGSAEKFGFTCQKDLFRQRRPIADIIEARPGDCIYNCGIVAAEIAGYGAKELQ